MILVGITLFWFLDSLLTYELVEMKEGTDLKELFASGVFLLGGVVAAVVTLLPYGKDLGLIRKREYRLIEATFIRYDFQPVGGKNSRMRSVPLFCDTLTREILTFNLDEELVQDVCYRIGYLPHTKTAVIEKLK